MTSQEKLHFRDRLRDARAATLEDAENFVSIVQVLEDLGKQLKSKHVNTTQLGHGLGAFEYDLKLLATQPIGGFLPHNGSSFHTNVDSLFRKVREGRNEAVHQGVFARHLADSVLELSLVIEDALTMEFDQIQNFMVRDVVQAQPWQPLSFIRLTMLRNSFSYLPFEINGGWKVISDLNVATYLSLATTNAERQKRLLKTLNEAMEDVLETEEAYICKPEDTRQKALSKCNGRPVLVMEHGHLLGLSTPFDLL